LIQRKRRFKRFELVHLWTMLFFIKICYEENDISGCISRDNIGKSQQVDIETHDKLSGSSQKLCRAGP